VTRDPLKYNLCISTCCCLLNQWKYVVHNFFFSFPLYRQSSESTVSYGSFNFLFVIVRLCVCEYSVGWYYVCACEWVWFLKILFMLFNVYLLDFCVVFFWCPYQCKWLLGIRCLWNEWHQHNVCQVGCKTLLSDWQSVFACDRWKRLCISTASWFVLATAQTSTSLFMTPICSPNTRSFSVSPFTCIDCSPQGSHTSWKVLNFLLDFQDRKVLENKFALESHGR